MWKLEPNVNLFSQQQQQQTTTGNNDRGQSDPCVFPAKVGDTKNYEAMTVLSISGAIYIFVRYGVEFSELTCVSKYP